MTPTRIIDFEAKPEAVAAAERGHLFAESESMRWWGRLLPDDGRAPQRHVRLHWNVATRGDRTRITEVGASFLPCGKMLPDHPAYRSALAQFESYTHTDGNIFEDWIEGARTAEHVWERWRSIGFATSEHATRALGQLAVIQEADWARDPFFDTAGAVRPWDSGEPNPDDAHPTLHVGDDTDAEMLGIDAGGRQLWGHPVSTVRARRLSWRFGNAALRVSRDNGALLGNLQTLKELARFDRIVFCVEYAWGPFGWLFNFEKTDRGPVRRVAEIPDKEKWITCPVHANDPPLDRWEYVPEGLFRTKLRRVC